MPRFAGGAYDAAPLIVQVKTTASGPGSSLVVFAIEAKGQNSTGSASRPVLYRPGTPGTGTPVTPQVRGLNQASVSAVELLTSFSANPSLPSVGSGAFNLPIRVSWMTDPKNGIVASLGGALALYQNASGGHTISGSISWEEI